MICLSNVRIWLEVRVCYNLYFSVLFVCDFFFSLQLINSAEEILCKLNCILYMQTKSVVVFLILANVGEATDTIEGTALKCV